MIDDRKSGGFGKTHSFRDCKRHAGPAKRIFRHRAALRDRKHAVTDLETGHVRAYCIHNAGHFVGRINGKEVDLILALDCQNVEEIQPGMIVDAHFSGARFGFRDIFERHGFRFAPSMHAPGFHGLRVLNSNSLGYIVSGRRLPYGRGSERREKCNEPRPSGSRCSCCDQ